MIIYLKNQVSTFDISPPFVALVFANLVPDTKLFFGNHHEYEGAKPNESSAAHHSFGFYSFISDTFQTRLFSGSKKRKTETKKTHVINTVNLIRFAQIPGQLNHPTLFFLGQRPLLFVAGVNRAAHWGVDPILKLCVALRLVRGTVPLSFFFVSDEKRVFFWLVQYRKFHLQVITQQLALAIIEPLSY